MVVVLEDGGRGGGKGRAPSSGLQSPHLSPYVPLPASHNLCNRSSCLRVEYADPTRPRTASARRDSVTRGRKIACGGDLARAALYSVCRLREARMCDRHEGSVEEGSDELNAGRGSRVEGGCWLDISAACLRVLHVLDAFAGCMTAEDVSR